MHVTHDVLRYAADEDMAESSSTVGGNNDEIDTFIRHVADFDCRRTVNHANRISNFGSRCQ